MRLPAHEWEVDSGTRNPLQFNFLGNGGYDYYYIFFGPNLFDYGE
jgi:hypothetical protein